VLERIERDDARVRAFITVTAESALEDARRAEAELRRGEDRGPLHGVPVAVKDLYDTRGVRTTCGSRILADRVPQQDADAVERLRRGGAVLLGKTNMNEFACGVATDNPHYGDCHNPWNTAHVPGGSSGGSAAAVASGMAHLALGTDTGGSIRMPAAYCGITGLKPTYGLLSRYGIFPNTWDLDHSGPFGRDAEDTALLLGVLAGHDPRDPTSTPRPVPDFGAHLRADVRGLKAGLLSQQLALAEPAVRDAVLGAAHTLEGLGVGVEEVTLPHEEASAHASTVILYAALSSGHLRWLRSRPQDYGADLREALLPGVLFPAAAYVKAQRIRTLVLREARAALERVDVLLTATTPYPAPAIGATPAVSAVRLTRLGNLLGYPAVSTPSGWSADGLPLGLQIIGRPWEDGLVLRFAHAYQQASELPDFSRHRPALSTS
jgi:aspartyl-tRNA(Asn)/glutamyl-tRNA(Gln) amidotransferase subunit A